MEEEYEPDDDAESGTRERDLYANLNGAPSRQPACTQHASPQPPPTKAAPEQRRDGDSFWLFPPLKVMKVVETSKRQPLTTQTLTAPVCLPLPLSLHRVRSAARCLGG